MQWGEKVKDKIINILSEVSGYDKALINGETQIRDIGINSMAIVQTMVKIEQLLGIEIDDDDMNIASIITFDDLFKVIRKNYKADADA